MKSAAIHPFARTMAACCNALYEKGFSPASSGNVSAWDGDILWMTAKTLGMGDVTPQNLVMLLPDEKTCAEPGLQPTSERLMHQAIYQARPELRAVVHAHPPRALVLAVAHQPLDQAILSEIVLTLGEVPLVPFHPPGSAELAEAVAQAFKRHDAVLLANHGMVAAGKTLQEACHHLELVESFAEIYLQARQLGGMQTLTPEQAAQLR